MKKNLTNRSLSLTTETVRTIAAIDLTRAAGGDDTATRNVCSKECLKRTKI